MPNGTQPSEPEVDALVKRSELLKVKVASLEASGFSHQEAMQILFMDIEAGLTEFGTPPITPTQPGGPVTPTTPPPLDLSTLVGSWNITPNPILEECSVFGGNRQFKLQAGVVDISLLDEGQSRAAFLFLDAGAAAARASGTLTSVGGSDFEYLGLFESSGVRLRVTGKSDDGSLETTIRFQYDGTPFDVPIYGGCRDGSHPRTLVRI
jgi:hypothetical protein